MRRFDETQDVAGDARSARFVTALAAGRTKLQAWFLDAGGKEIAGAYYVTVRHVE